MGDGMSTNQQKKLGELLRLACTGDVRYQWLHSLALQAGYAKIYGEAKGVMLVTAPVLAKGFRVSERTIRSWIREGMPVYQTSAGGRGHSALYDIFDVARWREKRLEVTGETDPLMRGGSSPALEAYRREKVREAKRKNEQAEGRLIELAVVCAELGEFGRAFRTQIEILKRSHPYGQAIQEIVIKALDQWNGNGKRLSRRSEKMAKKRHKRRRKAKRLSLHHRRSLRGYRRVLDAFFAAIKGEI